MNPALLFLAWLAPLVVLASALGRAGRWWVPAATLPAIATVLLVPAFLRPSAFSAALPHS